MRVTSAAAGLGRAAAAGPAPATHPVRARAARPDRGKASKAGRSSAAARDRAEGLARAGWWGSALGGRPLVHHSSAQTRSSGLRSCTRRPRCTSAASSKVALGERVHLFGNARQGFDRRVTRSAPRLCAEISPRLPLPPPLRFGLGATRHRGAIGRMGESL